MNVNAAKGTYSYYRQMRDGTSKKINAVIRNRQPKPKAKAREEHASS